MVAKDILFDSLLEAVQFLKQERDARPNRDEDKTKQNVCHDQEWNGGEGKEEEQNSITGIYL